jgi:hypothetical protein
MPMLDGHGHQMPWPRLRLEDHDLGAKRSPTAGRLGPPHPQSQEPTWHHSSAARHRVSAPTLPLCARRSGCRSSTVLPTRRWSRVWPPRPRRSAGTGSSCGTTCAGGPRSGRWPTRGSRWRRSPPPPNTCGSAPWSRPWPAAGRPRSPGRPPRWTGSARGRLTLGVSLGSDRFGSELSKTGEQLDDRPRGHMLDEALEILTVAWSGAPVHHRGRHYTVEGIQFLPRPVQQPGVPVWVAGFPGNVKPLRRAARHDGFFPANLEHPISSPRSSPPSPTSASTRRRRTTSPSVSRLASTRRLCQGGRHLGGWSSSRGTRCRLTACAACFATARGEPEP